MLLYTVTWDTVCDCLFRSSFAFLRRAKALLLVGENLASRKNLHGLEAVCDVLRRTSVRSTQMTRRRLRLFILPLWQEVDSKWAILAP